MRISKYQKKLLRGAAVFIAVMVVCALVSRGIYSMGMPKVVTAAVTRMEVAHEVSVSGIVVGGLEEAVAVEPNLLVASILVEAGQQIDQGTPLVQLDLDYLARKIEQKEIEITQQELAIQALSANQASNEEQQDVNRARANEDYAAAQENAAAAITQAGQSLEQARTARNALGSQEAYINMHKEQDDEYQRLRQKAAELKLQFDELKSSQQDKAEIENKKEEWQTAAEALRSYTENLEATLGLEWETQREQLDRSIATAQQQQEEISRAEEDKIRAAARAIEDADVRPAADSSLAVAEITLEELKRQLDRYQELQSAEGIIKAQKEGDIIKLNVSAGDLTPETALLTMTNQEAGYRFQAEVSTEQKKFVALKDRGVLALNGDTELELTIDVMKENIESGNYQISGKLNQQVRLGDMGTLTLKKSNGEDQTCVPLSALHQNNDEYYVYVAERRQTILGEQLVAVKYPVKILERNDQVAAVESALSEEMQIIESTSELIYEGDTVRLQED